MTTPCFRQDGLAMAAGRWVDSSFPDHPAHDVFVDFNGVLVWEDLGNEECLTGVLELLESVAVLLDPRADPDSVDHRQKFPSGFRIGLRAGALVTFRRLKAENEFGRMRLRPSAVRSVYALRRQKLSERISCVQGHRGPKT